MMTTRYDTRDWVKATVPGTVFGSYVLEGLEPDPNFADNAYKVDKAKYDRNFWYRTEFNSPEVENGERVWLNFEGVNRKGEIFFNGTRLGLLVNPEKPDVPLNKNDAFQKVQKRRVQEKR